MIGCSMRTVQAAHSPAPRVIVLSLALLCAAGCLPAEIGDDQPVVGARAAAGRAGATPAGADFQIVAFGDSLTAGLGLPVEQAYPARLQERIEIAGYRARVVNAGVSGETTAGGLRRIGWSLTGDVEILILALGGNDGLRGLPVEQMRDNLAGMIAAALESGARVLLAGMEAPPNFGADYADRFRAAFEQLAAEYDVVFVPFLLDGVAGVAGLNQADGIHPNAAGADRVAAHVWSALEPILQEARAPRAPEGRSGGS